MNYYVTDRCHGSDENPSVERMREVIDELDQWRDAGFGEFDSTWLTDEQGRTIEVFESRLVQYRLSDALGEVRHLIDVPRKKALELWVMLAHGQLSELEAEPWRPGSGVPEPTDEEKSTRQAKIVAHVLKMDRQFFDRLGPERPEEPCRHDGCTRGAVRYSTRCRRHHFEQVVRKPCPFDD